MMKYIAHCTVNVWDGVSTLTSRPTEIVEAKNERDAVEKVKEKIKKDYETRACSVNSIVIPLLKKIGG